MSFTSNLHIFMSPCNDTHLPTVTHTLLLIVYGLFHAMSLMVWIQISCCVIVSHVEAIIFICVSLPR